MGLDGTDGQEGKEGSQSFLYSERREGRGSFFFFLNSSQVSYITDVRILEIHE